MLVSALIQRSYPYLILKEVFTKPDVEICISEALFEEYIHVLNRKKFNRFPDFKANTQALLLDIEKYSVRYSPSVQLNVISDKDDNKLLELAEACKADFLITGNHNDFTMKSHKTTIIVTPKEYWEDNIFNK